MCSACRRGTLLAGWHSSCAGPWRCATPSRRRRLQADTRPHGAALWVWRRVSSERGERPFGQVHGNVLAQNTQPISVAYAATQRALFLGIIHTALHPVYHTLTVSCEPM